MAKHYGIEISLPICPIHGVEMVPYVTSRNLLEVRCPEECNETAPVPAILLEAVNESYAATPGGWPEIEAI